MREYAPRLYEISRYRYKELKAICAQYPENKFKAQNALGLQGKELSDMPRGNKLSSPTEKQAERRMYYLRKNEIIDKAISQACNGDNKLEKAIFQNLVYNKGYQNLRKNMRYLTEREFFKARREALKNLDNLIFELYNKTDL